MVSGRAAAALHGLDGFAEDAVEFLVPRELKDRTTVGRVTSCPRLTALDRVVVDGLAWTSATMTVVQLLGRASEREVGNALDSATRKHLTAPSGVRRRLDELGRQGRRGVALFEQVMESAGVQSWLERRFLALIRSAGLPTPAIQRTYRSDGQHVARVDFDCVPAPVIVEVGGRRGYLSVEELRRQEWRRNQLQLLGRTIYFFAPRTWSRTAVTCSTRCDAVFAMPREPRRQPTSSEAVGGHRAKRDAGLQPPNRAAVSVPQAIDMSSMDAPSSSPIFAEGLVRHFGSGDDKVVAVDGVDLDVKPAEIFGFLGPNGAGKSTTVRMLTTLLRPTAGTARVAGFDVVTEADAVRRSIGVALQDAAIDPLMTGAELLRLQAVLYGLPKSQHRSRTGELLERVGLAAAADRRVGTYSGGMRRRLDLALSLIHQPTVLFLDEPTTGLDPMSRIALWEEIRRLNNEGTTVLLTTQYLEEADKLAERVAIIDQGRIVRRGVPRQLRSEVGTPTLFVSVDADQEEAARSELAAFGESRPSGDGELCVGLAAGAAAMSAVVRRLDEAGITVHNLQLREPSLDDVFAEATGHRLEGAHEASPDGDTKMPEAAGPRRGRP